MKLSYRLKRVCGEVFSNGNILFTPDGNSIISPVGNRVTYFDLVEQSSTTLPFENRKNIKRCAISHSGRFLITVDVEGHALFINFPRKVVLHRFNFKRKVYDIKFSPDDEYFAVTFGNGVQIWKTPSVQREFVPLTLSRTIAGFSDSAVCLDWSVDSKSLVIGSRDLTARVYYNVHSKYMAMTVLSGHRDSVVGCYFAKDSDLVFSVAKDGAVFTWAYEPLAPGTKVSLRGKQHRLPGKKSAQKSPKQVKSQPTSENEEEENSASESEVDSEDDNQLALSNRGSWNLKKKEFLWEPHTIVTSTAFNKNTGMMVIGFNKGVFGIYEMPGCVNIHKLSVSHYSLNTAAINTSGEWLALGSSRLGQLLIWEWQSETYVLKQQGHLYGLNAVDYSSDGQYIATGGEDSKVKIWSASSGFCTVTFTEHVAPVTGVKFVGKGNAKALLSCSLDGSVRAHDLLRYRNFKTLTAATPVQFTCLAADASGEIVCAGAMDPFQIYVWALQTGTLLDILSGHEGPIACLDFSQNSSVLASGSWDGTLKLWDVYKNECMDTFEHGCDVLSVCFRSDGKEVCSCATNGLIYVWDVENGTQLCTIEGRHDISGGRLTTDVVTADNSSRSKHFTTVAYSPDGSFILAGGHSKYVCIYSIASQSLVKKFQLSHNRSLEGVLDQLRSDRMVDGISLDNLGHGSDDDFSDNEYKAVSLLPGADGRRGGSGGSGGADGSRTTRPMVLTAALKFSPTGREWGAASTQGLQVQYLFVPGVIATVIMIWLRVFSQIFSLDETMLFAPTELDTSITPQSVVTAVAREDYGKALAMALQLSLSEHTVIKLAVDSVPINSIELVVKSVDIRMLKDLLKFLASQLVRENVFY
jgi:periodic tryptophan protein 2